MFPGQGPTAVTYSVAVSILDSLAHCIKPGIQLTPLQRTELLQLILSSLCYSRNSYHCIYRLLYICSFLSAVCELLWEPGTTSVCSWDKSYFYTKAKMVLVFFFFFFLCCYFQRCCKRVLGKTLDDWLHIKVVLFSCTGSHWIWLHTLKERSMRTAPYQHHYQYHHYNTNKYPFYWVISSMKL